MIIEWLKRLEIEVRKQRIKGRNDIYEEKKKQQRKGNSLLKGNDEKNMKKSNDKHEGG